MPMNGSGGRRHRLLRARAWLRRHPPPPDPPLRLWERTGLALAGTGLLALPVLFDATWALNGVALLPWVVLAAHPRYRAYWGSSLGLCRRWAGSRSMRPSRRPS